MSLTCHMQALLQGMHALFFTSEMVTNLHAHAVLDKKLCDRFVHNCLQTGGFTSYCAQIAQTQVTLPDEIYHDKRKLRTLLKVSVVKHACKRSSNQKSTRTEVFPTLYSWLPGSFSLIFCTTPFLGGAPVSSYVEVVVVSWVLWWPGILSINLATKPSFLG